MNVDAEKKPGLLFHVMGLFFVDMGMAGRACSGGYQISVPAFVRRDKHAAEPTSTQAINNHNIASSHACFAALPRIATRQYVSAPSIASIRGSISAIERVVRRPRPNGTNARL